jgi:type II secretory pathway pseudopilin PulG
VRRRFLEPESMCDKHARRNGYKSWLVVCWRCSGKATDDCRTPKTVDAVISSVSLRDSVMDCGSHLPLSPGWIICKWHRVFTRAVACPTSALISEIGIPFAIGALICGIMAYSKIKAAGGLMLGKGQATAGIVMAGVSIVILPIVGILAGMLLPALNTAREKARTASCISNMKAISTAITMYADDNEGNLMPGSLEDLANGSYLPVGSTAFICPKSQRAYEYPGAGGTWQANEDEISVICDGNHMRSQWVVLFNDGRVTTIESSDFTQ